MRLAGALLAFVFLATFALALVAVADENTVVSLNVKDADIRDVVEMIAKSADLNYVLGSDVRGRISSLVLVDVPARVALEETLNQLGLKYHLEQGIFKIYKPKEEGSTAASLREVIQAAVPKQQEIALPIIISPKETLPALSTTGVAFLEESQEENYVTEKIPVYFADAVDIAYIFGGDEIETRMSDYSGGGYGSDYGGDYDSDYGNDNRRGNNRSSRNNRNSSYNTGW